MNKLLPLILCIALLACCICRERYQVFLLKAEDSQLSLNLPSPEDAKLSTLGFDQLMADMYWLVFINYEGDTVARGKDNFRYCSEYLDLITGLDPHFLQPYWFTAFSVGADQKRPDLADKIIRRGLETNPNNWYLPYIAGLNMYLFAHNEKQAAKYYRQAARFPDAPHWLAGQAAILESGIPSIIKEIRTWDAVYRSNEPERVRLRAKDQLIRLWLKVFNTANKKEIKERARQALIDLDYELN